MHIADSSGHYPSQTKKNPCEKIGMGFHSDPDDSMSGPQSSWVYFSSGPFNCGKPAPLPIDNRPVLK